MRHLVLSFDTTLRRRDVSTLKRWIKEAEKAGITLITGFVQHLKRDQAAVENAGVSLEQRSSRSTSTVENG